MKSGNYDIELTGWNDGVEEASVIAEDEDFLFYRKKDDKRFVYGIIGKKYIASLRPNDEKIAEPVSIPTINRQYFCGKKVFVELAKKEGLMNGFFDFKDDDYRDVVIDVFEQHFVRLQYGKEFDTKDITKIEEL